MCCLRYTKCRSARRTTRPSSWGFCLTGFSPGFEPFGHLFLADFLFTVQFGYAGLYLTNLPFLGVDISGNGLSSKKGL